MKVVQASTNQRKKVVSMQLQLKMIRTTMINMELPLDQQTLGRCRWIKREQTIPIITKVDDWIKQAHGSIYNNLKMETTASTKRRKWSLQQGFKEKMIQTTLMKVSDPFDFQTYYCLRHGRCLRPGCIKRIELPEAARLHGQNASPRGVLWRTRPSQIEKKRDL